jgi:hypothetical protein
MADARVRLTIEVDVDFDRLVYGNVYNEKGEDITLSDEECEALTPEEMVTYDRRAIEHGDFDVQEWLGYGDFDPADVKLEIVKKEG